MNAPTVAPRDHLASAHALAAKRADPAPLTMRALAVELAALGVTVSPTRLAEIANKVVVAEAYSEALGMMG